MAVYGAFAASPLIFSCAYRSNDKVSWSVAYIFLLPYAMKISQKTDFFTIVFNGQYKHKPKNKLFDPMR